MLCYVLLCGVMSYSSSSQMNRIKVVHSFYFTVYNVMRCVSFIFVYSVSILKIEICFFYLSLHLLYFSKKNAGSRRNEINSIRNMKKYSEKVLFFIS